MKKSFFSVLLVAVLALSCAGCQTARNTEGNVSDQNNQIVEEENDQTTEDENVVYQEAYKKVELVEVDMKWYVENDEVKDLQYSEYTDEIIPGEKYSKYDIPWIYVGGQLYLGQDRGWYYMSKIPNSEDKVLLESWVINLDYEAPAFRVFDINNKEIVEIYPENVETDYVVTSADVSADLKDVVFIGSSKVYYYDGEQITKIDQFDDKIDGLNQPVIMIEDNKILVMGYNSSLSKVYCYSYDRLTGEMVEREYMHAGSNSNGVFTHELQPDRECRYGIYYQENCLTVIDFLTGEENKTELSQEKIRWVENINEDYFFVLADYAYIIEKSTGRIAGQTEHEMIPSDAGESFTVKLVPSDEDLYFYLHQHSCEEAGIYKIEMQEENEDETNEAYKPEYLETVSIDNMEEHDKWLNELEKYHHGEFISYNPETRELVLKMYEWITVRPEDDPEEKYPNGFRLEELGEETVVLAEDCEMWLFVEGSSFLEYGTVSLEELTEMIESGYTEHVLMVIYRDGEEVKCLKQQYLP